MKYDYSQMSVDEICDAYDEMFPQRPFMVSWDDDLSSHRQEIIDYIESGTPQDAGAVNKRDSLEGAPGIDFVE